MLAVKILVQTIVVTFPVLEQQRASAGVARIVTALEGNQSAPQDSEPWFPIAVFQRLAMGASRG